MNKEIRILFQARHDIVSSNGGDAIQLKATKKYLEKLGISVTLDPSPTCDCSTYDIVHLFNMTRPYETLLQLNNAKRYRKQVCLSTIYWNMKGLREEISSGLPHWYTLARSGLQLMRGIHSLFDKQVKHTFRESKMMRSQAAIESAQIELLNGADILLPNSKIEMELLQRDFPSASHKQFTVVPNCIDSEIFSGIDVEKRSWGIAHGLRDFVVCAGRIEHRKNQTRLLKALSDTDIPVVLVGKPGFLPSYVDEVRQYMKLQDLFLSEVKQSELCEIYSSARVHVLPSLYETPGLSSLEAGAMGCNLVMSEIGSQREYFGDYVEYCDPYSVEDIAKAIQRAWQRPWPNYSLSSFIHSHFTWEVAARETLKAYMDVLEKS